MHIYNQVLPVHEREEVSQTQALGNKVTIFAQTNIVNVGQGKHTW